jgi:regulator of CtrA degradation
MPNSATINPRIVETLYHDALLLADEVRHAFEQPCGFDNDEPLRIALSSEGLRTTTRMMHAIAWLLNHRAYFAGEMNQFQLRRNGRLSPDLRQSEAAQLARLQPEIVDLVESTQHFYDRLLRLDARWRLFGETQPSAIERLRERLQRRLAS